MTDITELSQSEINDALAQLKQISEYPTPSTQYARVLRRYIASLVEALEKAQTKAVEQGRTSCELFDEVTTLRQRIAELESRTVTVKLPEPKDKAQGWKVDPEFINKVQESIGYDDECQCWEGTPSMELVEAVLIAAAGIKWEAE